MNIAAWALHVDGFIRVIANTAYLISIPGWIPMYALGFSGIRDSIFGIIAANAIAWCFWFLIIWMLLKLRHLFINRQATQTTPPNQPDPYRRAFLSNATLGTLSIGALATPGYATLVEPWSIKVRRYTIPINDLDPSFDGLKIVQLADTHLGPRIPASFVKQSINLVLDQSPDLVFLTGDHIHDGTNEIDLAAKLCQPLIEQTPLGVIGVLGNHDWWGDGQRMSKVLSEIGVRMIDNDRVWLDPETRSITSHDPGNRAIAIVGFGDLTDDHIDIERAFKGVQDSTPRIVLSHNPDSAELASLNHQNAPRIDLMCSGHTHGGQVRLPLIGTPIVPSQFGSKYAGGLVDGPAFRVHISRGIGMSMLPVRIGVPPEISVLTLTRA